MVQSDSTKQEKVIRENLYIISETQLRSINQTYVDFDSLKLRFKELSINSRNTLQTTKAISLEIAKSYQEESKYSGIVIKNYLRIKRGLNFQVVWLKIRTPLIGLALFYLGNVAAQKNWIVIKF